MILVSYVIVMGRAYYECGYRPSHYINEFPYGPSECVWIVPGTVKEDVQHVANMEDTKHLRV